ncbi:MAG TPA: matrixin family metalloprotease [Gemmatimonadaceae bacterium]|nr:matrixin family metalloprotease [Gemmatimonadaceae bacterium]
MKRLDLAFAVSLSLLAFFVGYEAVETRQEARELAGRTASFGATPLTGTLDAVAESEAPTIVAGPAEISSGRDDLEEVRRRLELSSAGTYISDLLLARDSALARWPDRRGQPLRVWVQPEPALKAFDPNFIRIVEEAFTDWTASGIPLLFTFVRDSGNADIRVTWVDRFNEPISGKTLWAHDERWWIVDADIQLALHHRSGDPLDASAMRAIARHEVGHLIGLDHTKDSTAIMTARVRVRELSSSDRATAQLLYLLPPGPIGGSRVARR